MSNPNEDAPAASPHLTDAKSPSKRGVYILANDRVYELVIAFLNSFRRYNPNLSLCLIPFDDKCDKLLELRERYGFNVYRDHGLLTVCDEMTDFVFQYLKGCPWTELDGYVCRQERRRENQGCFRAVGGDGMRTYAIKTDCVLVSRPIKGFQKVTSKKKPERQSRSDGSCNFARLIPSMRSKSPSM
jgi:hypothetical protein